MTKQQLIADKKRQLSLAEDNLRVAEQNKEVAARIVSELKTALNDMGVSEGRARKGKVELPDDVKLKLKAGLTGKK